MKRNFGEIIGERKLQRQGGQRSRAMTVTLGKPRRRRDNDWECPFRITGQGVKYGYGVDAIQALSTALEGIRVMLEQSGEKFSWLSGEMGYTGFDRPIPSSLGVKFNMRLNRVIDREVEMFVGSLKKKQQNTGKVSHRASRQKK
jgi:hypothetical protein